MLNVEKASFTPLVFRTTGGMADEATKFYKHLAGKISRKSGQEYSVVICFLRTRLRFELLKTCLISMRGYRGKPTNKLVDISELDVALMPQAEY